MEDAAKMWLLIGAIDVFVISLRPLTITEDDILDDLIKDFNGESAIHLPSSIGGR